MAVHLNPPPGWPHPPPGWAPPPGWQPDPSWPPPPHGWPLWVDDQATASAASSATPQALNWAAAGAALVVLGSLMPFVSSPTFFSYDVKPEAKTLSAVFGLGLVALAVAMRPMASRIPCGVLLLCASGLGALGYGGFAFMGTQGFTTQDDFGFTTRVEFTPGAGLLLCCAGSLLTAASTIATLRATTFR